MQCKEPGCDGVVEGAAPVWFNYDDTTGWELYGIGDEAMSIQCTEGHDNFTPRLAKELEAYIEYLAPGAGWVGSDPRSK
jgi:hypothetical protein